MSPSLPSSAEIEIIGKISTIRIVVLGFHLARGSQVPGSTGTGSGARIATGSVVALARMGAVLTVATRTTDFFAPGARPSRGAATLSLARITFELAAVALKLALRSERAHRTGLFTVISSESWRAQTLSISSIALCSILAIARLRAVPTEETGRTGILTPCSIPSRRAVAATLHWIASRLSLALAVQCAVHAVLALLTWLIAEWTRVAQAAGAFSSVRTAFGSICTATLLLATRSVSSLGA